MLLPQLCINPISALSSAMDTTLVIGDSRRIEDFRSRTAQFSSSFHLIENDEIIPDLQDFKLVFDLCLDEYPARLAHYAPQAHLLVIGGAVRRSLAEMAAAIDMPLQCRLAGINALPTFLKKKDWELSVWKEELKEAVTDRLKAWEIGCHFVADRVGMVTPRIVAMIINEACFTVQEGTASVAGIDQAMRLGVNYPGGPFEWADQIGPRHIYEVLLRMAEDSGDSRYKIAPYLKHRQLKAENFRETQ